MRFLPISGFTLAQMAESSSVLLMAQLLHAQPGIGPTGGLSESPLSSQLRLLQMEKLRTHYDVSLIIKKLGGTLKRFI